MDSPWLRLAVFEERRRVGTAQGRRKQDSHTTPRHSGQQQALRASWSGVSALPCLTRISITNEQQRTVGNIKPYPARNTAWGSLPLPDPTQGGKLV